MAAPPRAVAAPPPFGYLAVRAAAEKRSSRIAVDFQTHGFAAFLKRSALRMSTGAVDYGAKFRFWCTTSHTGTRKPANLTQKWRIGTMKSGKSDQGAVGERTLTSCSSTPVHQKRRSAPFSRQPSCGAKQRRRPKANWPLPKRHRSITGAARSAARPSPKGRNMRRGLLENSSPVGNIGGVG